MSNEKPDYDAQAREAMFFTRASYLTPTQQLAVDRVANALRAAALDAGDRVWVAWRDHHACPTCDGKVQDLEATADDPTDGCEDCYGEGVISTEALLGIERKR